MSKPINKYVELMRENFLKNWNILFWRPDFFWFFSQRSKSCDYGKQFSRQGVSSKSIALSRIWKEPEPISSIFLHACGKFFTKRQIESSSKSFLYFAVYVTFLPRFRQVAHLQRLVIIVFCSTGFPSVCRTMPSDILIFLMMSEQLVSL